MKYYFQIRVVSIKSIIRMKYLLFLLVVMTHNSISAQAFELFGGLSKNKFYDIQGHWPNDTGKYTSKNGQYIGVALHQIRLDDLDFGITISYEKYGGDLWATVGGRGGGRTVNAMVDKSILSLGLFPFNKHLFKKIKFSLGIVISKLIRESFSGRDKFSLLSSSMFDTDESLNQKYNSYSTSTLIGLRGALSYDFKFSEGIILSPHYTYYIGLFEEFIDFPRAVKSMRHQIGLGIKQNLN